MNWNIGPVTIWSTHVNVGMCWDGTKAWRNWGPDCSITAVPVYGAAVTWCGVYNNNNWHTEPGLNGYTYPFQVPWQHRSIYMRYDVYGNGTVSSPWGGG